MIHITSILCPLQMSGTAFPASVLTRGAHMGRLCLLNFVVPFVKQRSHYSVFPLSCSLSQTQPPRCCALPHCSPSALTAECTQLLSRATHTGASGNIAAALLIRNKAKVQKHVQRGGACKGQREQSVRRSMERRRRGPILPLPSTVASASTETAAGCSAVQEALPQAHQQHMRCRAHPQPPPPAPPLATGCRWLHTPAHSRPRICGCEAARGSGMRERVAPLLRAAGCRACVCRAQARWCKGMRANSGWRRGRLDGATPRLPASTAARLTAAGCRHAAGGCTNQ